MSELLKLNVNEHCEKKNGLTYLSWAWAWAEVLKIDPEADWEAVEYPAPDGTLVPAMFLPDGTAMVKVKVTIHGRTKRCVLPVMNHKNQAIQNPNAFQINTAVMRCMTKAISMHGLGLYIYAGEDLPEGEEPEKADNVIPASFRSSATMGALEALDPAEREYVEGLSDRVNELARASRWKECIELVEGEELIDTHAMALWAILDSKTRSAYKKAKQQLNEKAAA